MLVTRNAQPPRRARASSRRERGPEHWSPRTASRAGRGRDTSRRDPELVAADPRGAHRRDAAPAAAARRSRTTGIPMTGWRTKSSANPETTRPPRRARIETSDGGRFLEPHPRHRDERLPAVPARRHDRAVDVEVVRFRLGEEEATNAWRSRLSSEGHDEPARRGLALHLEDEEAGNVLDDPAAHHVRDRRSGRWSSCQSRVRFASATRSVSSGRLS